MTTKYYADRLPASRPLDDADAIAFIELLQRLVDSTDSDAIYRTAKGLLTLLERNSY